MKTENLAIVITDIVGFTEATSNQSRRENEELLAVHNRILYPVIRRSGGKIVKTIGDALLIVFKSPTDAMLCSMAMQDSLFGYNRTASEEKRIHIRVAASVGEVRVVNKDIFGEPVNLTSRIESITPHDEIYFSDAVYMAMNKAEVPCVEVGIKTLKGIPEPVKIWQIPRFSRPRLVPEDVMNSEDMGEFAYPYGGAHLITRKAERKIHFNALFQGGRPVMVAWAAGIALVVMFGLSVFLLIDRSQRHPPIEDQVIAPTMNPDENPLSATASMQPMIGHQEQVEDPLKGDSATSVEPSPGPSTIPAEQSTSHEISPKPELAPVMISKESPPSKKDANVSVKAPATKTQPLPAVQKPPVQKTGMDSEIANLIKELRSDNSATRRRTARVIAKRHGKNTLLLNEMEKELLNGYNKYLEDRHHVDAISWMCKVLGASGDSKYRKTLALVAENSINAKIKKYAQQSMNQL